ncbi:MAG: hypothetical protein FWE95_07815 [Planctomycetaceae bacterium]|nr:hypothetical protein [Planctomycetaceae bacterium]
MTLLTREAIQRKRTLEIVEVDVSELGEIINHETGERERTTVFVREMSVREKGLLETALVDKKGKTNTKGFRALLVIATACDADGNLIFRPEDADYIGQQPLKVIERICTAARRLNDMLLDHEQEEDEEELVKN